jgi:hypothetical protein
MTENMITVALIIGDPGREDLQLDEGSLASGQLAGQETPAPGASLEAVSRKLLLVFGFRCSLGRHQEQLPARAPCLRLALRPALVP